MNVAMSAGWFVSLISSSTTAMSDTHGRYIPPVHSHLMIGSLLMGRLFLLTESSILSDLSVIPLTTQARTTFTFS